MTSARRIFQRVSLLSALLVLTVITGCDYSISEQRGVVTPTGCDTVAVSYANVLHPLFESTCFGCHNGGNAGNLNVDLSTYEGVKAVAESGQLLGAITHSEEFSPMPQNMPQLDSCTIAQIRSWIRDGALNN